METNGTTTWLDTAAGKRLQERLNDEQTVEALDHLLSRVTTLERAVDRLTAVLEKSPGLFSMAADITDETYQRIAEQGVDLETRLQNALHLAERLTAPSTVAQFDQLLETAQMAPDLAAMLKDMTVDVISEVPPEGMQLDERLRAIATLAARLTDPVRVEQLHKLLDIADMAPDLVETVNGALQEMMQQAPPQSLRLDERIRAVLPLLDKLTSPETAGKLSELLALTDMAPDLIHTVGGMAGEVMQQLPPEGLQLDERLRAVLPLLDKLTQPETAGRMQQLLALSDQLPGMAAMSVDIIDEQMKKAVECGLDLGKILQITEATAQAFCEASREERRPMGPWGMLRAPLDRDRQVAIGFLMTFLKKFGQRIALVQNEPVT